MFECLHIINFYYSVIWLLYQHHYFQTTKHKMIIFWLIHSYLSLYNSFVFRFINYNVSLCTQICIIRTVIADMNHSFFIATQERCVSVKIYDIFIFIQITYIIYGLCAWVHDCNKCFSRKYHQSIKYIYICVCLSIVGWSAHIC